MSKYVKEKEIKGDAGSELQAVKGVIQMYSGYEIVDIAEYEQAGHDLAMIKDKIQELEEKRKGITVHMDNAKKEVMELFKPVINQLQGIAAHIGKEIMDFKGNMDPRDQKEVKPEGIAFRANWTYTIEDASKIPAEYYVIDEKRIGQVVRATKGSLQIPGVKIYKKESVMRSRS
jgi:hypothetical protein